MGSLVKAVLSPVTSIFSSIFSPDTPPAPAAVAPPIVEKPTPMQTPDDAAVQAAKKRAAAAATQRSGRVSTILTQPGDDKLGA